MMKKPLNSQGLIMTFDPCQSYVLNLPQTIHFVCMMTLGFLVPLSVLNFFLSNLELFT